MITLDDIKNDKEIDNYIRKGDEYLNNMGYTEHSYRHLNLVASIAGNVLERLGYSDRCVELASIAGYLHDIGNVISRHDHGTVGATIIYTILTRMNMDPEEIAAIISAVGNHEEEYGQPVNHIAAALILADKTDVHRSRVRNMDIASFDVHDRVNHAVERSFLRVNAEEKTLNLELDIDLTITNVLEYSEIFLVRMLMCRRAASFLDCDFSVIINGVTLM